MKKTLLGFLCLVTFTFSCTEDQINIPTCEDCNFTCLDPNETDLITNDCIDNWDCNFKVTAQSKVDLDKNEGLSEGNKNVFQMINSTEGDLTIADDEYTNILVFELDESQSSFSAEDTELQGMKVHYRRICFCSNVDFLEISEGCLQGEKQTDGTWFVQGNINVPFSFGSTPVKFEAQFVN